MPDDMTARLTDLLSPAAVEHGLELVLVEMAGARQAPLVRVYLDREGGIGIDDIAQANKWLRELVDSLGSLGDRYTLEVSSPGIDRPLVTRAHFERFTGSDATVAVSPEIDGHKRFSGTIRGIEADDLLLEVDGSDIRIPLRAITRARLRAEIDFGKEGTAHDGL